MSYKHSLLVIHSDEKTQVAIISHFVSLGYEYLVAFPSYTSISKISNDTWEDYLPDLVIVEGDQHEDTIRLLNGRGSGIPSIQTATHERLDDSFLSLLNMMVESNLASKPIRRNLHRCKLFLSYARRDKDIKTRIVEELKRYEVGVWTDDKLTPGTAAWTAEIQKALKAPIASQSSYRQMQKTRIG
jgi:hypothetical protein